MFPLSAGLACFGRCRWSLAAAEELVSGGPRNLLAGAAGMARDRACRPAAGGARGRGGCGEVLGICPSHPAAGGGGVGSGGRPPAARARGTGRRVGLGVGGGAWAGGGG